MIIETQKNVSGCKNFFLLHYSNKDKIDHVQNVHDFLNEIPFSIVVPVHGGESCPTNPLPKISIFNVDNEPLMKAIQKIADHPCSPGSLIPLKSDEMKTYTEAIKTGDLITL